MYMLEKKLKGLKSLIVMPKKVVIHDGCATPNLDSTILNNASDIKHIAQLI